MPEPGLGERERRLLYFAAVVAIAALYLPFLQVPWEYDDKVEIIRNRIIRTPSNFTEMAGYNPFRVLLLYTFSADLWLWGIDRVAGFRATNIVIHLLNTLLLASLLDFLGKREQRDAARHRLFVVAGTLVFAVHPLAIESVTYISGRSSSLATLFTLLSVRAYVAYLTRAARPEVAEWLRASLKRSNVGLGVLLGCGAAAGVPVLLLSQAQDLTGGRTALLALGGAAGLLVLAAAAFRERWQALAPRPPTEEARRLGKEASRAYALAWVAFVLGCLTKEIAATLPGILFLLEATLWQRSWRGALGTLRGRLFPFFAIPAFLVVLRAAAYGYIASPTFIRPWTVNLLTQFEVVPRYLKLLALPWPQSIYHDYPPVPLPGAALTWVLGAALVGVIVLAAARRQTTPALAFGILLIFGTLAPTSSVFALKETMVEHRTYLPSVGYAFIVAWLFADLLAARLGARWTAAALAGLLGLYCTLHVSYDLLWRSEETLWSHAVQLSPHSSDGWRYLGDLYKDEGRFSDAVTCYGQALASRPSDVEVRSKLGSVLARSGRVEEAERELRRALEQAACYTPALNNLANLLRERGDTSGAVALYAESLGCNPENAMAHLGLGHIYYGPLRDRLKAAEHYSRFLELADPHHSQIPQVKEILWRLSY